VEIVDSQEKIDAFLPVLDGMMSSVLVTIEKVQVLQYGASKPESVVTRFVASPIGAISARSRAVDW
jgi:hypothetical protein